MSELLPGVIGPATDVGTVTGSSVGTTITASGSANTKGSYTQLVASTSRDTAFLLVQFSNKSASTELFAVDIAVGGSGSEQVILPNLVFSSNINCVALIILPFAIPAGTRLSARCQADTASNACELSLVLAGGSFELATYNQCDAYGFNAATTLGVTIDPGASANTKGAYVQLTASTSRNHSGIFFLLDNQNNAVAATQDWLLDIAVGASGSEQIVLPNLRVASTSSVGALDPVVIGPIPLQIPAGTRIAARAAGSSSTSLTRKFGLTAYGLS